MVIDLLDRKLLYALDANARESFAAISRTLRAPEETIRYRYRKLVEEGVINRCYPVIDVGLLGITVHKLMLKLTGVNEQQVGKIAKQIASHPDVNWVCTFDGGYQLGVTLWGERVRSIVDFIDELRGRFHTQIGGTSYAVNIDAEFFARSYFNERNSGPRKAATYGAYARSDSEPELDEMDWSILRLLAADARTPVARISDEVRLSAVAVARRIDRLERSGVIAGYRIVVDNERFGNLNYYLLVYLNSGSAAATAKLLDYLRAHHSVVYLIRMLGAWDLDICIEVPDAHAYRRFIMELTREFSQLIRHYETLFTLQLHKFSIMPPSASGS